MKILKTFVYLYLFTLISFNHAYAQVTIGTDKPAVKGALLDLKTQEPDANNVTSSQGLQLSRVALVDVDKLEPMLSGSEATDPNNKLSHIGLVVYNVTEDDNAGLIPGIWVWDGEKWISLLKTNDGEEPVYPALPLPGIDPPDRVGDYDAEKDGFVFIRGIGCLSCQEDYDPDKNSSYATTDDNFYLEENVVQTYTLHFLDNVETAGEYLENIIWSFAPDPDKPWESEILQYIEETEISDDKMSFTIKYPRDAANILYEKIQEQCPNDNNLCFAKLRLRAYFDHVEGGQIHKRYAQRTCYLQNYTCCDGYICEDCAYDYKSGFPGDWARVGNPSDTQESSYVKIFISGTWNDGTMLDLLDVPFNTQSSGDLCVYKIDAGRTENWAAAILDCQDGDFTDGRDDWGWYLPNLMELKRIYEDLTIEDGNTPGDAIWSPQYSLGIGMFGTTGTPIDRYYYYSSTEAAKPGGSIPEPTQTNMFATGDGSVGPAPKDLSSSAIQYKVRCVRRMR